MLAASTANALWYLSRGTGVVSLLLLTASVVLGMVTSVRWMSERWPRFVTTFLHRNVSLLAVVFLIAHISTVVLDGFAPIGWKDAVVPFASPYRSIWLGLGTVAFDLVLALVVTSLFRNRIGPRAWRIVHWLAYVCWPFAVVHGLATGTDAATRLVLAVDALCVVAVIAAVWWRIGATRIDPPALRGSVLAVTIVAPIALVAWLAWGPLAAGWAQRAGTPAALLRGSTSGAGATATSVPPPSTPATTPPSLGNNYAARYTGTINRSIATNGAETLEIDTALDNPSSATLIVVLRGANNGTGLIVQSGTATINSSTGQSLFSGTITSIQGSTLVATPNANSASSATLVITIDSLDNTTGRIGGTVTTTRPGER
jgi:DMSO/TMAO reductase YedYZ heme-binding membrane subunit